MNPTIGAVRAGLARGLIELRHSFTSFSELSGHLFWPLLMVVVLFFVQNSAVGPSGFSLSAFFLPSMLGMSVAFNGLLGMSGLLSADRRDGTLLRAKAIPNGMLGYLVSKIIYVGGGLIADLAIVLITGSMLVDSLTLGRLGSWLALAWILALGMVAVLPLGAILGSLNSGSGGSQGTTMLTIMGLVAVSGIFYPITAMPQWLQWIGQSFPIYWLGLGMRSALLPDSAVSAEIGASWRHLETAAVLGAWATFGLIIAPIVLRRMARRESGSSVAARREKALRQLG
ncbi:MAG: ABC transporter permease [Kutzneria sp.]|nr:ABC transporter permease [Kutzneria sp.]